MLIIDLTHVRLAEGAREGTENLDLDGHTRRPSFVGAIFAADFRPLSRPRRGNTSGVEQEMNKATVPQLLSEPKQAQNGVTTAKSSVANRMVESI